MDDPRPTEPEPAGSSDAVETPQPPDQAQLGQPEPPAAAGWVPPTAPAPTSKRRILVWVGLVAAVVVLAALVGSIFLGSQVDPYDEVEADFGARLLAMPEFKARYGNIASQEEAFEVGQKLALAALPRLDDASLREYWTVLIEVLNAAEPDQCGRVLREEAAAAEMEGMARTLDLETFSRFMDLTLTAFEAELKGGPGVPAPGDAEVDSAFEVLGSSMGADRVQAAAETMNDASASGDAVCDAALEFLEGILDLPEPSRAVLLRYMTNS